MCRLSGCPRRQVRCETSRPPLSLLEGSSGGLWCVVLKLSEREFTRSTGSEVAELGFGGIVTSNSRLGSLLKFGCCLSCVVCVEENQNTVSSAN